MKALLLLFVAIPLTAYGHKPTHDDSSNTSSDYVIKLEEMTAIEAGRGEKIHLLRVAANPLQKAGGASP